MASAITIQVRWKTSPKPSAAGPGSGPLAEAGLEDGGNRRVEGTARFPSIDDRVRSAVKGWPLGAMIDEAQHGRLLAAARAERTAFVGPDGTVAFPAPAHIVTAVKD